MEASDLGVSALIVHGYLLCFNVIDQEVVEFLSHFKNASKDENLLAKNNGRVTASCNFSTVGGVLVLNLGPLFGCDVQLPQVSELIVVLILSSKHEHTVALADSRVSVSLDGESLGGILSRSQGLPLESAGGAQGSLGGAVNSGSTCKSTESDDLFVDLHQSVVVNSLRHIALLIN